MWRTPLIAGLAFLTAFIGMQLWNETDSSVTQWELQEPCVLQQAPCLATGDKGSIKFSLSPTTIPLMQELTASVTTTGIPPTAIQQAEVIVEGVNMFMGYQRAQLTSSSEQTLTGHFTLPVCSNSYMQWQATVTLTIDGRKIMAVFPFATQR